MDDEDFQLDTAKAIADLIAEDFDCELETLELLDYMAIQGVSFKRGNEASEAYLTMIKGRRESRRLAD